MKIRIILSSVVLFLSVLIDSSLIFTVILCEAIILFFPLYYQNLFLFFRMISLLLYYSYFQETGSYFTYGGDDLGFTTRFIKDNSWLTLVELFSGSIINYPLYYIINKYYYFLFLKSVSFDLLAVHLVLINNFILTLAFVFYRKISMIFYKKDYALYLLLLTPFIYFGSIYLRDVYNFLFYSITFYVIVSNKNFKIPVSLICFLFSFFIRPETSFVFIIFPLFFLKNNIHRAIFSIIIVLLAINFLPQLVGLFRNFDQLAFIYDQAGLGLSSQSGIGEFLRSSDSIYFQIIYFLYGIYKPIPPFLFIEYSFENLYQFFGNILWYVIITYLLFNFKKIYNNYYQWLNFIFFLVFVFFISFIGGTYRHSLMFVPILTLHFFHFINQSKFNISIAYSIFSIIILVYYFYR